MAVARPPSLQLRGGGQSVLRAAATPREDIASSVPATHRGVVSPAAAQGMSIGEMERSLAHRPTRRIPEQARDGHAPQTARALLEENRQLIQEKQERKALARKNSREFVEKLLAQDRLTTEGDRAKDIGRRHAQRELAQYYKAEIAEKERARAGKYRSKVDSGVEIQYFPFVEGETIDRRREEKSATMREEMRSFLGKQREKHPPRADSLLAETSLEHAVHYGGEDAAGGGALPGEDVAPHLTRHPRFLSRAQEHHSRRLHDAHVRKALEDKVMQTRQDLENLSRRRQAEHREWEEGMQVNDAVRADICNAKAAERKSHAAYLKQQMEERQHREQRDTSEKRAGVIGYYGPEEKELQGTELHQDHCAELIRQMDVDSRRRAESRGARLRQEQRLVDNGLAEMSRDRQKERLKNMLHREVLTTTWKSQQKIKQAMNQLDSL